MSLDVPAALAALLAAACGYHTGPACEMCADAVARRREKGWTDEQITDDVTLYLHDRPEWYRQAAERVKAKRDRLLRDIREAATVVDPVPATLVDRCADRIAGEDGQR